MILGTMTKQSADVVDYDIDYSEWLPAGDHVQSAVATASIGLTVQGTFVSDPFVKVWTAGGVSGRNYLVTVITTSQDGRVKQDEFNVRVKDYT